MSLKNNKQIKQKIIPQQNKSVLSVSKNLQNQWVWLSIGVILLTTFALYFKTLKFDFLIWDDNIYIHENERIRNLNWENIKLMFSEFYFGNYHPLSTLTYAIEYKLVGESAYLYHINNIIFHLFNTLLVFVLIRKISPKNTIVAFITAAFFAIHPMHIESVAWVSERKDVLYTFFFLLSLIFYTNFLKSEKLKYLIFASVFFLLSCLSKSAAVILPIVMLLFDYYFNRKLSWKIVVEKIPLFAISLAFGIAAMYSQKAAMPDIQVISTYDRVFIISNSLLEYISKAFVPINLSALYPYPSQLGITLPTIYYLSAFFVGLVTLFVWYSRKWGKDVVFGFLFFLITIILVLQIVTVGNATMADRYTYIPYIGIFFIVGKLFEYVSSKKNQFYKNGVLSLLAFGFMIFVALSNARIDTWKNDEALFSDIIKKHPQNPLAYNNRGCYYLKIAQAESNDNTSKRQMYFEKSFQDFNKLIEIDKGYSNSFHNRGISRFFLKDYTNAIKDYNVEILNNPKDEKAYFDRGNAKNSNQDYAGAIKDFDKTIEMNSRTEGVYFNRGNAKKDLNDFVGALKDYDKAIEIKPTIKAYNNRSMIKCMLKDYVGAIADYDKMIQLDPRDTTTIKNRKVLKALID
ncbi:MAG: glycosyltransferase family 39 protein [Bacteroidota bacterium]